MAHHDKKYRGGKPQPALRPSMKGNKYALGNMGGAPKVYTQEWLAAEAKLFLEWMDEEDSIYFNTFAINRGYHPRRFREFAKASIEFSQAYDIAIAWQEQKLVSLSLFKVTDPNMTKFVLANKHEDWKEKQEVKIETSQEFKGVVASVDGVTKDLLNNETDER